jgi:hypothetical protein
MSTSPKRAAPSPGPDDLAADSNKRIKLNVSAASPSSPAAAGADDELPDAAAVQELEPDKAPGKDKEKVPIDSGNLGNISNGMDSAETDGRQGGECLSARSRPYVSGRARALACRLPREASTIRCHCWQGVDPEAHWVV